MPAPDDTEIAVIKAAFGLAAERNTWRGLTLEQIADAAGVTLADLRVRFPDKADIPRSLNRLIDLDVLRDTDREDRDEPPRDRLFDVLIRRFEALAPYRAGIAVIAGERGGGTPFDLLCDGALLLRSMAWSLEAAGISAGGWGGCVRVSVLAGLYLNVARIWLTGDPAGLAKTEAALDKALKQAESWQNTAPNCLRSPHKKHRSADTPALTEAETRKTEPKDQ